MEDRRLVAGSKFMLFLRSTKDSLTAVKLSWYSFVEEVPGKLTSLLVYTVGLKISEPSSFNCIFSIKPIAILTAIMRVAASMSLT